jgi:RIO-like serine/threonine protein kinase
MYCKTPVIKEQPISDGQGSYGSYYRLDEYAGVKIIAETYTRKKIAEDYIDFLDDMIEENYYFVDLADAAREMVILQMLEPSGKTPKPIGLCWVKRNVGYRVGIMMEHIVGKEYGEEYKEDGRLCDRMTDEFQEECEEWYMKYGIGACDWHEYNIIKTKKGPVRIDFTPFYTSINPRFQDEFVQRVHYELENLIENYPGRA